MDFKIKNDTGRESQEQRQQDAPAEKKSQTPQLLLLLLLVAGFGYIYFFTGLIKPLPEQKSELPPPPQVVKKALPTREAALQSGYSAVTQPQAANTPAPQAVSTEGAKKNAALPAEGQPAAQAKPAAPVVAPSAAKSPAAVPGTKKDVAVTAAQQKQPEKKNVAAVAVKKTDNTATDGHKKGSAAAKKQESEKKPVVAAAKHTKIAPQPADGGKWMLLAGNYLLENEMSADMVRIRKAGLEPQVIPGKRVKAKMTRLFLGEYAERAAAQSELDKLKRHTADAFLLEQGGTFSVFAGSYLLADRVAEERERLAAAGFRLTAKKIEVAIPAKGLSAGTFSDKNSAEAARRKLIAAGVAKAVLVRQ